MISSLLANGKTPTSPADSSPPRARQRVRFSDLPEPRRSSSSRSQSSSRARPAQPRLPEPAATSRTYNFVAAVPHVVLPAFAGGVVGGVVGFFAPFYNYKDDWTGTTPYYVVGALLSPITCLMGAFTGATLGAGVGAGRILTGHWLWNLEEYKDKQPTSPTA